ncbi:MAG TPA: glycosyltransferase family 87 protein, partial [Acidobacteriaceae bacterium]
VADINLNPPCLLPLFHALSHLSLARFAMVWTAGSFVLLFATVAMLLWNRPDMQHRQVLWLLLARPVFETLWSGQVYFLLFFFSALALVCAERRRWLGAAFAIGLVVAIKPTMIFWPLFLFVGNYRRLALHAVVIAGAVSIAPLPFYGVGVYRAWLVAVLHDNHWLLPSDIAIPAIFARHGMHLVGLGLAAAVTILLCWTIRKKKLDIYAISGIGLCAGILCAPLAWYDYVLAVAPWFAAQHWGLAATLVALALMLPPFAVFPPIGYFAAICLMTSLFLIRPADQLTHA